MNQGLGELLSQKQVMQLICVSRDTFRRMRKSGVAPGAYQIGKRCLYKKTEVLAWLERQKIEPEARNEKAPLTAISEADRNANR